MIAYVVPSDIFINKVQGILSSSAGGIHGSLTKISTPLTIWVYFDSF